MEEPANRLRAWLPHVMLLLLVVGVMAWLAIVVWPLRDALMLAASVALLTYPIVFLPSVRFLVRRWPQWGMEQHRLVAAASATAVGGLVCGVVVVGGLWLGMGRLGKGGGPLSGPLLGGRSGEGRVGEEGRIRWSRDH